MGWHAVEREYHYRCADELQGTGRAYRTEHWAPSQDPDNSYFHHLRCDGLCDDIPHNTGYLSLLPRMVSCQGGQMAVR
ncbi:hypothetical protein VTO42DRAFT_5632 [Malbranchea cinnamomea]